MLTKIIFQNCQAFLTQNACRNLRMPESVVEYHLRAVTPLVAENVFQIIVARTVDQPPQLYPNHGAAAHEARLATGVHRVLMQIRDAGLCAELANKPHFAVESWIVLSVDLIFIGEYYLAVLYKNCSKRLISMLRPIRTIRQPAS